MMKNTPIIQQGSCTCGQSTFSVEGTPLVRFICHCQICQDIYKKPFADVVIFPEKSVKLLEADSVEFKKFRAPPAVNRGICKSCAKPVFGVMWVAPFTRFAFVPAMNLADSTQLPEAVGHVFYHRHVNEMYDGLPKVSGYVSSQLFLSQKIFKSLIQHNFSA
ncbi:hypothetical protein CDG60_05990 [Acinetobacter chinensis]|uniref:CENP-V/GFA domain-containing protein n=1 Tax=Acinetobacter chinensis TaxID=2004650 RepID=A0A3B7M075_9GAMM|nr:GFA family protein [Acinetobacter chinensis]AXY56159.1 hypothetical protein CDG60_05990 [Acinetobacter chinensis]